MAKFLSKTPVSNIVQPTGDNPSFAKSSSSTKINGELSTEALIEASKQFPTRLEKLHQENEDLRQQVQSLQRSLMTKESHSIDEKRQLLAEMGRLKLRHAAMAERKVNMNQRRSENTMSTNAQSDLEREYKNDFRDGARVDAIRAIEAKLARFQKSKDLSPVNRLKAYRLACYIFEISYECAWNTKETFLSFHSSVMETLVTEAPTFGLPDDKYRKLSDLKFSKQSTTTQDSLNEVMVRLKEEAARHNLEKLVQTVKKELKGKWKENGKQGEIIPSYDKALKNNLKSYIADCTQYSWRIVTQVPPLRIDCKSPTYNPSYHTESQVFASSDKRTTPERWADSQKRKEVMCYVWPTLYDWENRVIEKGDVVLKGYNYYVSAV